MRNFQRLSLALLLFIFICFKPYSQHRGDSFSSAKARKNARLVYVHAGVNGFAAKNANGVEEGLLIDLIKEFEDYLSKTYGISVTSSFIEAENKDFKLYIEEMRNSAGGVFGLSNTSVREERKEFLNYSPSFLNNISVLVSHWNFPTLTDLNNISSAFENKVGFGVPSTTNYSRMINIKDSSFPNMKINEVTSSKDIMDNVTSNTNGFGFADIHYYLEYLEKGKPVKRHPVGDQKGDEFGIVMPKNSDWDVPMNAFMNEFLATAKYREMVVKNLGRGALRMIN